MKKHTCLECGIEGYSPDGEIPHGWVKREFALDSYSLPDKDRRRTRVAVVCSTECFGDMVNEYESAGAEVIL